MKQCVRRARRRLRNQEQGEGLLRVKASPQRVCRPRVQARSRRSVAGKDIMLDPRAGIRRAGALPPLLSLLREVAEVRRVSRVVLGLGFSLRASAERVRCRRYSPCVREMVDVRGALVSGHGVSRCGQGRRLGTACWHCLLRCVR